MSHLEHKQQSPQSVNCALLVISDTRTDETDESGPLLQQKLTQNGHFVMSFALLKNDAAAIKEKLNDLLGNAEIQVIITSGGTGASRRDVTVETVSPFLEKKLDGFGELFRSLSYKEIGTASIMSRALAGVARGKVIICLPGSLAATALALDKIILPEIAHLVREASR